MLKKQLLARDRTLTTAELPLTSEKPEYLSYFHAVGSNDEADIFVLGLSVSLSVRLSVCLVYNFKLYLFYKG